MTFISLWIKYLYWEAGCMRLVQVVDICLHPIPEDSYNYTDVAGVAKGIAYRYLHFYKD